MKKPENLLSRDSNTKIFLREMPLTDSLHEMCPYSEFLWSVFFLIRTEFGDLLCKSPYSVRMRENTDQKNSKYRHFLRSVSVFHAPTQSKFGDS